MADIINETYLRLKEYDTETILSTPQLVTESFANLGNSINVSKMSEASYYAHVDINSAENVRFRINSQLTPSGTGYPLSSDLVKINHSNAYTATGGGTGNYFELTKDQDQDVKIDVDCSKKIKYLQLQVSVTATGSGGVLGTGRISKVYITKGN